MTRILSAVSFRPSALARKARALVAFGLGWGLAASGGARGADLPATPIRTIYVVPHSHTDIGFTDTPNAVAAKYVEGADNALKYAAADPDYRWVFESFWQLETWLARAADPEPMLALLREGRFGLSAAYATPHSSLLGERTLREYFALPARWGRARGLAMDWAILNDVPGHPRDLAAIAAREGIRGIVVGANQSLTKALPDEVCNVPFRWEGPDGSSVLLWISADAYVEAYMNYGIDPGTARFFNRKDFDEPDDLATMKRGVGRMLERFAKKKYPYDAVLALHAFDNWGSGASERLPRAVRLWNANVESPKLKLATPGEFFAHIEERHGTELETLRGGFGGQWEPVRTQAPTAMARTRAREAELFGAPGPPPDAEIAGLLVYWEHSFGYGPPWPGNLTREQAIAHNREQFAVVADWPDPPSLPRGEPIADSPLAAAPSGVPSPNGLFLQSRWIGPFGGDLEHPLPDAAVLERAVERLPDGALLLRHRVDRRSLGEASVVWTWPLGRGDAKAPVVVRGALGETDLRADALGGYVQDHFVAPFGFRVGGTDFLPHGPFVFAVEDGWLLAKVFDQSFDAEYKGGEEGTLTFEEAYPGEATIHEFAIEVRGPGARRWTEAGGR